MPVQPTINLEKTLFLFFPHFPPFFFVFVDVFFLVFFGVFWLFLGFCDPFLVSLKYATRTFFAHLLYFNGICRASQQS